MARAVRHGLRPVHRHHCRGTARPEQRVGGQEHEHDDQRADLRRGTIGFIFQFFALIPTLTAYENVEMPLLLNGKGPAERKARAMEMLEAVGLTDRAHHRPVRGR